MSSGCILLPRTAIKGYKDMLLYKQKKDHLMTVLFQAKSLNTSEKIVALALIHLVNEKGWSSASMRELGDLCRLHKKTVKYVVRSLEEKIDLNYERSGRCYRYRFPQWDVL